MTGNGFAELSLGTLAGGGAVEQFDRALADALANIRDPNTDPKAVRTVGLKLYIKPAEDRESGAIRVAITKGLASAKPLAGQIFIGERDGVAVAATHDTRQGSLFQDTADADGVVTSGAVIPLRKGAAS